MFVKMFTNKIGGKPLFLFLFLYYKYMSSFFPLVFKVPSAVKCRKFEYNYPNTSPIIYSLSPADSDIGKYTVCYINGLNFSKENTTGNSTVTFGDIANIPVTFYSSLNISFVVPNNLAPGPYLVQVVNNNYFPSTTYSNKFEYTLN
jgi:hypothetical protein